MKFVDQTDTSVHSYFRPRAKWYGQNRRPLVLGSGSKRAWHFTKVPWLVTLDREKNRDLRQLNRMSGSPRTCYERKLEVTEESWNLEGYHSVLTLLVLVDSDDLREEDMIEHYERKARG